VSLENRIAIVTGAATGIGRAIVERFVREGAVVIAADIDADQLRILEDPLAGEGRRAEAIVVDVSEPDGVSQLVEGTVERHGGLHVVVANAAVQYEKAVIETSPADWNRVIGVNLGGAYLLAKFSIPHLRVSGGGSIVNMASVNGFWAEPNLAAYTAAKGGLIALTKSIALDYGRYRIRCNCICPGYIDTGMAQRYFDTHPSPEEARAEAAAMHALGRLGRADEVASMALFLASDESSFCTAQAFIVDGGLSAGVPARD
jgi:NAD(P)-dependent dehydrogenase (short-subunit alcohol dehydrogenase family)